MSRTTYVVAPTLHAFVGWAMSSGYKVDCVDGTHPETGHRVRFVSGPGTVKHLSEGVDFLFLKHWQSRKDWRAIYNRALAIGRRS
jgi:hypothetical protein